MHNLIRKLLYHIASAMRTMVIFGGAAEYFLVLLNIYKYDIVLITLMVQYLLMLPSTLVFILLMLVLASSPRMDGWHPQKSLSWNVLHHILPNTSLLSILSKGVFSYFSRRLEAYTAPAEMLAPKRQKNVSVHIISLKERGAK